MIWTEVHSVLVRRSDLTMPTLTPIFPVNNLVLCTVFTVYSISFWAATQFNNNEAEVGGGMAVTGGEVT